MKKKILVGFLLFTTFMFSQNEANNWFFGENMGLRFNRNSARPVVQQGSLNTLEGCASISDANGRLLFYSDGSTAWTRTHQPMPNGTDLLGDESSTQSAIIVPNPTYPNIYYLFTVGSTIEPSGYHYYTVDLSLNNGLGDISGVATDLSGSSDGGFWSEKITAVETADCDGYWIISLVDNLYYSYKVTENGVDPTPVISPVDFMSRQSRGYLKISPNGKKLAVAHQGQTSNTSGLILYSFNNRTGVVANDGEMIYNSGGSEAPYGIEFSPSGDMLYASTIDFDIYKLYQFDLKDTNLRTRMSLLHTEEAYRGALQLGPDLKIYVTIPEEYTVGTQYLDVIHYPELKGDDSDFELDYIDFGNGRQVMQGLPPFIQSFFIINDFNIVNPNEEVTETSANLSICYDSTYTLNGPNIPGADYFWAFNDGTTTTPIPTPSPPHQLIINSDGTNTIGTYSLFVDSHDECDNKYEGFANITFDLPPTINTNVTLDKCDLFDTDSQDGLTTFDLRNSIDLITSNQSHRFNVYFYLNPADANSDSLNENGLDPIFSNTVANQVVIAKVFEIGNACYSLSNIELVATPSTVLAPIDVYGCDVGNASALFNLSGIKNNIANSLGPTGTYTVILYDSLENAINDITITENNYTTEATTLFFKVEDNGNCYGSGTINLIISTFPDFNSQETIVICDNSFPISLTAPIPINLQNNYSYYWSTNDTSYQISIPSAQTVTLTIVDNVSGCEKQKTFKVLSSTTPVLNSITVDVGDSNTVTISAAQNSDNLYALNNIDDVFTFNYQPENTFYNVPPGTYDVYVNNVCGTIVERIFVFGFQKFLTPNNDGYHDTWRVKGLDYDNFTFSDINIFDRYGKLLINMKPNSGWNGLYNGKLLPSSDYWFTITVSDHQNNTVITYKGHFSLVI
ncbi:T9SS type B sorting domain-containing protein [Flavobacteriaceae bacterium S0862]|nr:T9SS type B sorting domain-containing protein [Flavobacteriaceae bacterium S0862]